MSILASPAPFTSQQVTYARSVHIQVAKSDSEGYTFLAHEVQQGCVSDAMYSDGSTIYYASPKSRCQLGYAVHHERIGTCEADDNLIPYYNALADLKVFVDAAISVMAKTLEVIAVFNLLVIQDGRLQLIPRASVSGGSSLGALDNALYEAMHEGAVVINAEQGTAMAAALIAYSDFRLGFVDGLASDVEGSHAIKALYRRIAEAAKRAAAIHASWACLPASAKVQVAPGEAAITPL